MDRAAAARAVEDFLRALGHDPKSRDLAGTGERVAELWTDHLLDGYQADPAALLSNPIPAPDGEQVVAVREIETHVVCPHHLTIARGTASVAFLPGQHVVGLGALARVVDAHAHRLALQEDVGRAVVADLVRHLGARAAGCVLELSHGCLAHHGPKKPGARVRTVSLAGDDPKGLLLAALVARDVSG